MSFITNNNGSVLQKIKYHVGDVTTVDFGPNSFLSTGSGDKSVIVWEWKIGTGYEPTSYSPLLGHKYAVTCVRFAPEGCWLLASASVDGHTILWNVKNGQLVHSLVQSGGNGVRMCCFNYDGSQLCTAGEGGILCLWDLANYSLIRTIDGHDEESIQGIGFTPDAMMMASGDVTGTCKLWHVYSVQDGRDPLLITVRDAHDLGINALEFSSQHTIHTNEDGMTERTYLLVTCGNDHLVNLWQVSLRHQVKSVELAFVPQPSLLGHLKAHNSAVSSVRISPKGDFIASTSIDKTTRLWQISSEKCIKTLEGHSRYVACCAFSRNQTLLATGSNDKSVTVWDLSGECDLSSPLSRSTSASLLTTHIGSLDGQQNDSSMVNLLHKLEDHKTGINTCHFDQDYLATGGSDHSIMLWKWCLDEMSLVGQLEGHRYAVNQVEFAKDGLLASCSLDGTALIWDTHEGEIRKSGFHVSGCGVRCVRFSPDFSILATGGDDDYAYLFSSDSCELISSLEGHGEAVSCLTFSLDSIYLMTGCADGHARLYSVVPMLSQPILIIDNCHDLGVNSADFSPVTHTCPQGGTSKYELATCGHDCFVRIWKLDTSEKTYSLIWKLSGHGGSVSCVRFSPNLAELIASTATDKTCRLWDSYSGDCLHVLNLHTGIVTCCAFSPDSTLLATGSMDKTVLVWELPKDLAFQSFVSSKLKPVPNPVESWSVDEVNNWLEKQGVAAVNLSGWQLVHAPIKQLVHIIAPDEEIRMDLEVKIEALRKVENRLDIPNDLLCPITHQLMREPVLLADGYTYERTAIESWLSSGHMTSPMTNAILMDTDLEPNSVIKSKIESYIDSLTE